MQVLQNYEIRHKINKKIFRKNKHKFNKVYSSDYCKN